MRQVAREQVGLDQWPEASRNRIRRAGCRFGHVTVRRDGDKRFIETLVLDTHGGSAEVVCAEVPTGEFEFPSLTTLVPAAHWGERAIGDMWGLRAVGHPRWKSLILHEAWPPAFAPFAVEADGPTALRESRFLTVVGAGVHEIPVGPIHAGVIEPGHFRFSCLGEVVANLEIRLGYQHRGIEKRLAEVPWIHARHVAESASSDATVANALAHAVAIEQLFDAQVPHRANALRTVSLEIERLANHLGDLGGLAADIGFALMAASFAKLRGMVLGLGESLAGSRLQKGFVVPGGVAHDLTGAQASAVLESLALIVQLASSSFEILFENPGVIERMEGVGVLRHNLAEEFGMVGPAARASGSAYDARACFRHALFPRQGFQAASERSGDVLARATMRKIEAESSMRTIEDVLSSLPPGPVASSLDAKLPSERCAVGVVESWRGELLHWMTTGPSGEVQRYAVRDPSFQNWTGLAIAVRNNLVADFPLINKSFNLSYSGNDL